MERPRRRDIATLVLAIAAAATAQPGPARAAPPEAELTTRPSGDTSELGGAIGDIARIRTTLPGLKPVTLRDALALTLTPEKQLDLATKIPPCDGEAYQPLTDDPAVVKVTFLGLGDRVMPSFVIFRRTGTSVSRYDLIGSRASSLTVTRNTFSADHEQGVELFQNMANGEDRAVRLTVTEDNTKVVELTAKDAEALVRQYPGPAARYLRPMLRELGADGVLFAGSRAEAYQVLAADLPPDPEVKAKVEAVLPKLDSDASAEREAGQRAMSEIGQRAANVLMTYDRSKLTPQQFAEVDTFLTAYSPLSADEARAARASAERLASYLSLEDATIRRLAYARLKVLVPKVPAFDPEGSPEDRAKQAAAIEEFLVPTATAPATRP